jgi:hypothetical protein
VKRRERLLRIVAELALLQRGQGVEQLIVVVVVVGGASREKGVNGVIDIILVLALAQARRRRRSRQIVKAVALLKV